MMTKRPKFIAYYRVSDAKTQGKSGLGIAGQKADVQSFVHSRGGEIIGPEYTEVETGKDNQRPELAKAINRCRKTGATLLVAKLDRLSRDAGFLMTLRNSGGIEIAAANMPEANTIMFMVMAGMAQQEREYIAERTVRALAEAKKRGTKLGGFRANAPDISQFHKQGVIANKKRADEEAEFVREDIEPLVQKKLALRVIAKMLSDAGVLTPHDQVLRKAFKFDETNRKPWSAQGVKNVIKRLGIERHDA